MRDEHRACLNATASFPAAALRRVLRDQLRIADDVGDSRQHRGRDLLGPDLALNPEPAHRLLTCSFNGVVRLKLERVRLCGVLSAGLDEEQAERWLDVPHDDGAIRALVKDQRSPVERLSARRVVRDDLMTSQSSTTRTVHAPSRSRACATQDQ